MAKKLAKKKPAPAKTIKKAVAKVAKKAPVTSSKKAGPVSKPFSKTELLTEVAGMTDLSRKQVSAVFECLQGAIERHVKKSGPGTFIMPGLFKIQVVHKPATKARKGTNPFTGEPTTFKAKPARNVIKVKALKKLKEMV